MTQFPEEKTQLAATAKPSKFHQQIKLIFLTKLILLTKLSIYLKAQQFFQFITNVFPVFLLDISQYIFSKDDIDNMLWAKTTFLLLVLRTRERTHIFSGGIMLSPSRGGPAQVRMDLERDSH